MCGTFPLFPLFVFHEPSIEFLKEKVQFSENVPDANVPFFQLYNEEYI